ncbi:MAG: chemotaxis protein CheB [Armatimonadetes bacterium]|nr:chemotaxis protein CheB [Armatimonadota bacterium]
MPDNRTSTSTPPQTGSAAACSLRPGALVLLVAQAGASDAFSQVLSNTPRDLNAAFVALADVRKGFSSLLCERLRSECNLQVDELSQDSPVSPGHVLVAPAQMSVEFSETEPGGVVHASGVSLDGERAAQSPVRLREIAQKACALFGSSTVAIMLSGLGGDTVDCLRQVKEAGGHVITQDPMTALVSEGPRAAAAANLVDEVLPLWAICSHLSEYLEAL